MEAESGNKKFSLVELIRKIDVLPYAHEVNRYGLFEKSTYKFLAHDGTLIGYMLPLVAERFKEHSDCVSVDEVARTVAIIPALDTIESRNLKFKEIAEAWRSMNTFNILKGWRNELYVVYNPSHTPYLLVERAFSMLLGVITYGVHINGYIPPELSEDGKLKLWVPRRSYQKPTYPGMLDNTVAGGMGYPYGVFETCVKECYEEAGLDEAYVRENIKQNGVISYIYQHEPEVYNNEFGLIQPEVEFIFDLVMKPEKIPKPTDNEVQEFYLMGIDEVLTRLANGEFKYNCAGVIIDFLIRHGYLTIGMELEYLEIVNRIHRRLPFPSI
ncbi:hypothetical protein PACTADRAFT_50633 [Pachysolen tannophilus NRRL Y-2460]|uniref:Nudix hydrolase domain-containing protein n=1 Tax=Pachysolen tannophilus NRRL Y-2460 TaxID=669874 RepID=A0A1E4TSP2_PACTA|nr:hypothetical protein PACTADRAFT_50633 [Pachysolen tannophilus NRRL Y-2460]